MLVMTSFSGNPIDDYHITLSPGLQYPPHNHRRETVACRIFLSADDSLRQRRAT
jgi:predicted metal-dependent enzyme (double-stranded beta helix superfamily)